MNYKLTSVKILKELYKNFKSKTLDDEFTFKNSLIGQWICTS